LIALRCTQRGLEMTGKLALTLLLSAQLLSIVLGGTATGSNLDEWGLGVPTDASCSGVGSTAGWFVDRTYVGNQVAPGLCFIRQVWCTALNTVDSSQYRVCPLGEFYVADGVSANCVDSTSELARTSCGISVSCTPDSIGVYLTDSAAYGQTDGGFQFGETNTLDACKMTDNTGYFQNSIDLTNSNWAQCGVTRSLMGTGVDEGTGIKYEINIARDYQRGGFLSDPTTLNRYEEQHNGVTVTREKCFMMKAICYYNADGTVVASFYPSAPNTLSESDTETLDFNLVPRTCNLRGPDAAPINPVTEYVNDEVCFRGSIMENSQWHDNIRVSLRKCWATNLDPALPIVEGEDPALIYPLSDMDPNSADANDLDATFNWDCHAQDVNGDADPFREDFSFDAFRFQDIYTVYGMAVNYAQTIYICCDINACDIDDFTSTECTPKPDCTDYAAGGINLRQRREAQHSPLAQMSSTRIVHKMTVLPRPEEKRELVTYNLLSDTLALSMFAVGCVLAVVAVGLLAVLRRSRAQIRYANLHR
jgi:hypothetical protein